MLHVINGEHYAGAERVQDLLAQNLGALGFDVGFACVKPDRFPWVRQSQQAPLYPLPMAGRFDLRPALHLARIVRREGYRLIHAHTVRSALVAAVASVLTGVPMVYHVHSPASRDTTHRWRNRLNAALERICLWQASAIIAVSRSLAKHARAMIRARQQVFAVPNGVPRTPSAAGRQAPCGTWTLGTVALFRPRKGIEVLLRALAILAHQGWPVRLRAVGNFETPQYEGQIKALAGELGVAGLIDWVGFTQDVNAELARTDLFVLPSLFGEGMPMVVLEAMAAGVPVVATRVEGVPETIRHGRDGLLAEPGDAHDLAEAIRRFVSGEMDWGHMGANAIARHDRLFSDHRMAAGVAEVYRRVLGEA